jgi:hypothetical protein
MAAGIAASAAAQSGVEPSLLKKMLPILAMVAAGCVMKQASKDEGSLVGALGGILAEIQPRPATTRLHNWGKPTQVAYWTTLSARRLNSWAARAALGRQGD